MCNLQGALQRVRLMPSTKRRVTILHGLSGVLRPGRLTLLLGPPSSGKTTLLKALSGKLVGKGDLEASFAVSSLCCRWYKLTAIPQSG